MNVATNFSQLSKRKQILLFVTALLIVSFGQPIWNWSFGLIASVMGFALFWRILLEYPEPKKRFWLSTAWFGSVQLIQLYWLLSHPFLYIYALWILIAFLWGIQFGIIGLLIQRRTFSSWSLLLMIPALWTILEWSRLWILSGFPFNPVGLSFSTTLSGLQTASFWGVYGLSFLVMLINCLVLRFWINRNIISLLFCALALFAPLIAGHLYRQHHVYLFDQHEKEVASQYHALLVQTSFPVEESMGIKTKNEFIQMVFDEWRQILKITNEHKGKSIDLIAYPEFVVPFATFSPMFPHDYVVNVFKEIVGKEALVHLPPLETPFATKIGGHWFVNNAFWLQGIANIFGSDVISGAEDVDEAPDNKLLFYSSALYFQSKNEQAPTNFQRYEKRVLVPMGEYIPFTFLQNMAEKYGITGSFTCGKEAKIFSQGKIPFGVSICYEEIYGDLMRENKVKGAKMLVNLTSDVWYPNSHLIHQHFEHARLRTVEMGIPLVRACNTGLTCGVDSLGRIVDTHGKTPYEQEWKPGALYLKVPTYTYNTLYSVVGDWLALGISLSLILIGAFFLYFYPLSNNK